MAFVFAGQSLRIPDAEARARVAFSRSPDNLTLRKYAQVIPGAKSIGFFIEYDPADGFTLDSDAKPNWPDGQDRPGGPQRKIEWNEYRCERSSEPFSLGQRSADDSSDPMVIEELSRQAQQRMGTRWTRSAEKLLTDTAVVTTNDTMANYGGGDITAATAANNYIQKTVNKAVGLIQKNTGGAVHRDHIMAVMGYDTANAIMESQEYISWLKTYAYPMYALRGGEVPESGMPSLFGCRVAVHKDSIVVPGSSARTFYQGLGGSIDDVIVFTTVDPNGTLDDGVSRQNLGGPLDGPQKDSPINAATTSSLLQFAKEEMSIELDPYTSFKRIISGAVASDWDMQVTSPYSTVLVRQVLGAV